MDLYINHTMIEDMRQLKDCFKSSDLNVRNELLSYIRNGSLAEWLSEGNSPEETQMADAVSGLDYESDDVMLWRNVYEIIVGGECGEKVPSYSDCFELVSISSKDCIILEEKILPNVTPIIYVPKGIEVEMCFKFKVKEPKYASVKFSLSRFLKSKPLGSISLRKEGTVELCAKLQFNENEISRKDEDKSSKPQKTTLEYIIECIKGELSSWKVKHYDENGSIIIKQLLIKECSQKVYEQYKLANEGDAVAQYNLGYYFDSGQGIEQSYTEAIKWYRKSAEQGDAWGQYDLGLCYEYGRGVEQSYTEAVKWYRKSAEQGNAFGQCNLGVCYEYGRGVEQSYTEAVKWYRKSAKQGNAFGQYDLGLCYEYGRGVEQSYTEAVKWYRKSADQGNSIAQDNLGDCYYNGHGVEQSYAKAVKWYRKSAEQGYASAQYGLGYCYEYGKGVEQSYTEAVKWYRKSVNQGYAMAQCNLGVCYENGRGVEQSYTEAVKLYRMSAEQGNACGQYDLGLCYEYGRGVEKSHDEAVKWWRKSAEQGYASAIEMLKEFGLQ